MVVETVASKQSVEDGRVHGGDVLRVHLPVKLELLAVVHAVQHTQCGRQAQAPLQRLLRTVELRLAGAGAASGRRGTPACACVFQRVCEVVQVGMHAAGMRRNCCCADAAGSGGLADGQRGAGRRSLLALLASLTAASRPPRDSAGASSPRSGAKHAAPWAPGGHTARTTHARRRRLP